MFVFQNFPASNICITLSTDYSAGSGYLDSKQKSNLDAYVASISLLQLEQGSKCIHFM